MSVYDKDKRLKEIRSQQQKQEDREDSDSLHGVLDNSDELFDIEEPVL